MKYEGATRQRAGGREPVHTRCPISQLTCEPKMTVNQKKKTKKNRKKKEEAEEEEEQEE